MRIKEGLERELIRLRVMIKDYEAAFLSQSIPEAPVDEQRLSKKQQQAFRKRVNAGMRKFMQQLEKMQNEFDADVDMGGV